MSSDTNFDRRAISRAARNKGTALNMLEFRNPHPKCIVRDATGDGVIIPVHQDVSLRQKSFDVSFPPTTAVNGNLLTTGGSVDVTIPEGAGRGAVNNILVQFDITNSTGAACTLSPAPLLLRQVEVIVNGGQVVQTIYGDHLFTDLAYLSTENLTAMAANMNTTATLGSGTSIANNGTVTYTFPLLSCFISQSHIYLPAIQGPVIFRLYFKPGTETTENGATPTIANLRLRVIGDILSAKHAQDKMSEYTKNTLDFRFPYCAKIEVPITIPASTTTSLTLSGLEGMIAGGFLIFRVSTTGAGSHTYASLATGSYDIVDASNTSLFGAPKQAQYALVWDWQQQFGNTVGSSEALYPVVHAAQLQALIQKGQMTGFEYYENQNRLNVTTDSSWTTGTYYVCFLAKQYAVMRIINGRIDGYNLS